MKKFILVIVVIFCFQSWTKADDIRELEIEGISIGDNALDFFSKDIIDENTSFYTNSKKFFRTTVTPDNNEFNSIQMHIKNDDKYIVYSIAGLIYYQRTDPKKKCEDMRSKIVGDISTILDNTKKSKIEKDFETNDETGKSYGEAIYFDFKDDYSEYVKVGCVFYGEEFFKKKNWPNHLRLALTSSEFHYWLKDEAK
tara:strand:- start:232 stop:822 length:591 start_codon:yes stop_codon:yes gene_type:complete